MERLARRARTPTGEGNCTVDVEGAIEVHHLVLGASSGDGLLDLGPLSVEVSQRL